MLVSEPLCGVQVSYDRQVVLAALTFVKELRSAKGKALATEKPRLVQVCLAGSRPGMWDSKLPLCPAAWQRCRPASPPQGCSPGPACLGAEHCAAAAWGHQCNRKQRREPVLQAGLRCVLSS